MGDVFGIRNSPTPFKANLPDDFVCFLNEELDLSIDEIGGLLLEADNLFENIGFKLSLG